MTNHRSSKSRQYFEQRAKRLGIYYQPPPKQQQQQQQQSNLSDAAEAFLRSLRSTKFWIWDREAHRLEHKHTRGRCCFNHIIGLPIKNGKPLPLFDYEQLVYDQLHDHKHLFVVKSTGLGITEFMIRFIAWLCLKDDALRGSHAVILTGPRIEISIDVIDRIKGLFLERGNVIFDTKQTIVELNRVKIQAFPSNHVSTARGLANVSFVLVEEGDFFRKGEQKDARDVAERYIGKSNPFIVMVSTPNKPGGLFQRIEQEPSDTCLYKRLRLDYTYGLGKIYTHEEIERAKRSPSFEREYNLAYAGIIGNVFSTQSIERSITLGKLYNPDLPQFGGDTVLDAVKVLACDPAFSSSAFGLCLLQYSNGKLQVLLAEEYEKPDFSEMLTRIMTIRREYQNVTILSDSANPVVWQSLKRMLGERIDYFERIKEMQKDGYKMHSIINRFVVHPIVFSTQHKHLLSHCKAMMDDPAGLIQINPRFDKLITSLRTAEATEYDLDKEATSYDNVFDAFRMCCGFFSYKFKEQQQKQPAAAATAATATAPPLQQRF